MGAHRSLTRRASFVSLIVVLAFAFGAPNVWADWTSDVTVTATVPSNSPPEQPVTSIVLQGIAYPSSNVTVTNNGAVAVVVPADPQARFNVTLSNLQAATYTVGVYGSDSQGVQGPTSNFTVTLTSGTTVTITGIFLGPTIGADKQQLKTGDTATVFGTTSPESNVSVFFSSTPEVQYDVTAKADGTWVKQLVAKDLTVGNHTVKSKATDPSGAISDFSNTVAISVLGTPPTKCTGKTKGDLNCDAKVDIVDFSVLLFYWNARNPANDRADLNQDGVVNIIDFSIMLFYWTAKTI